ncbi:hypothetical protein [Celeribacter sp.]
MHRFLSRLWTRLKTEWTEHGVRAALKRNAQAADALDAAVKEMLKQ